MQTGNRKMKAFYVTVGVLSGAFVSTLVVTSLKANVTIDHTATLNLFMLAVTGVSASFFGANAFEHNAQAKTKTHPTPPVQ